MDLNFFKQTRILDGGMGQELLARGMKPKGTLWSANALLDENYHQLLSDTHRDFIKSGAEVIVTTTFTTRRKRLRDNNVEEKFEYLNKIFPNQVSLLHGKTDLEEKEIILDNFLRKKFQILVSTTIIEVGIDFPNANVIIIENANKFGLSQLHQLRGRVGRGDAPSRCHS